MSLRRKDKTIKTLRTKPVNKHVVKKLLSVLAFTILVSALFHLAFVGVMAFLKRDISYINPLDFLGVTTAMPQYRDSATATIVGWAVLVVLFFVLYYFYSHFRVYTSIGNILSTK
jgi:hypothetical protein